MTLYEKIEKITDDYGQLHTDDCPLNYEDGSDNGCECAVKSMTKEIVETVIEYLSYDMNFKDEEQRKEAVKMYIENFN